MPFYDYVCKGCGPFTDMAPMAHYEADAPCPDCGADAPRALLSVPHFTSMNANRRTAHAVNEKNAHAPETTARTGRHPPGCGCCKPTMKRQADTPAAMKTLTGSRPWMISH